MSVKAFVRKHESLYKIALFLRGKPTSMRLLLPSDQVQVTQQWAKKLPNNFDLIIGIPRAGLLVADTLAMYFGVPWATPSGYLRGEVFFTHDAPMPKVRRVLVVDDLINQGRQLFAEAENIRKAYYPDIVVETASMYVTPKAANLVNHYYEVQSGLEEWHDNIKSSDGCRIASDLDGVLCKNPPSSALASPQRFTEWVRTAEPHFIPRFKLQAIVTGRPNFVRDETEKWLAENNVDYGKLLMLGDALNYNPKNSVAHKVSNIKKLKPDRFWESSLYEAKMIHQQTGVLTYCMDEMITFGHNLRQ